MRKSIQHAIEYDPNQMKIHEKMTSSIRLLTLPSRNKLKSPPRAKAILLFKCLPP